MSNMRYLDFSISHSPTMRNFPSNTDEFEALREAHESQDTHHFNTDTTTSREPSPDGIPEDDGDEEGEEFVASYRRNSLRNILLEKIRAAVNRLYHNAFKIRNPATRFNLSRILIFEDIDSGTSADILSYYAHFDKSHIQKLLRDLRGPRSAIQKSFTDSSKTHAEIMAWNEEETGDEDLQKTSTPQDIYKRLDSELLVERLARANNTRPCQFRYWQTHQKKLASVKVERPIADTSRLVENEKTFAPLYTSSLATTAATRIKDGDVELNDTRSIFSSKPYAPMQEGQGHSEVRVLPFPRELEK